MADEKTTNCGEDMSLEWYKESWRLALERAEKLQGEVAKLNGALTVSRTARKVLWEEAVRLIKALENLSVIIHHAEEQGFEISIDDDIKWAEATELLQTKREEKHD